MSCMCHFGTVFFVVVVVLLRQQLLPDSVQMYYSVSLFYASSSQRFLLMPMNKHLQHDYSYKYYC